MGDVRFILKNFDIAIVGNGVLGLSTAVALTQEDPNLKIAVIGSVNKKKSASLAAGAMLNCFAEINKFTLKSKPSINKFNMARQAMQMWPKWLEAINSKVNDIEKVAFTPGTFVILNSKAGSRETENFVNIHAALDIYKEPYTQVAASDIPGINPIDSARPLKALYIPQEGALNPNQLLLALEKIALDSKQVEFFDDFATQILFNKNKVSGIKLKSNHSITAAKIILAAGAFSQKLIDQLPSLTQKIPKILAAPGCSIILKANQHKFKHVVRTPVRASSCGIHILPYAENSPLLYMGSSNMVCPLPKPKAKIRDVYYLLERAMEQFNHDLHKAEVIKIKLGNRPVSFDTFPLIGATSFAGLWLLTGTYRDGVHDSPLLAQSMAKEILGKPALFDNHFQPERFPLEIMPQQEAIAEFADQYISTGYEHNMQLPKIDWIHRIREMAYKHAESLYAELEIDIGLSPDIMFMFDQAPEVIPLFRKYYQSVKAMYKPTPIREVCYA